MSDLSAISSEDDVWALLERLILGSSVPAASDAFRRFAWQPVLLYLPEDPLGHVVTPSMARALAEFHASLARSYAYLAYGRATKQVLRSDDLQTLDLKMVTISGSNGIEVNGTDLGQLLSRIASKMTGNQVTLSVVLLAVLYFSSPVAVSWIHDHFEAQAREREGRERVLMSEKEIQRLRLVTTALVQNPELKPIADLADQSKEPLVRSVIGKPKAKVLGADLTGDERQG